MISELIDRTIAAISPITGVKRQRARNVLRSYTGAESHRLNAHRRPKNQSADSEAQGPWGADALRAWARDLVRNNAYANGVIATIVSSVVGNGIGVESMCEHGDTPEANDEINEKRNKVFEAWSEVCDLTGQYTFAEVQQIAMREIVEAGECLIHLVNTKTKKHNGIYRPVPFALELIEADRLAVEKDTYMVRERGDKRIVRGVQFDDVGKPEGYWVWPHNPVSPFNFNRGEPEFRPASRMLHLFRRDRIGQTRGVSWFAPVIEWLRTLGVYVDNEMMASAVASNFVVAVKTESPMQWPNAPEGDSDTVDSDSNAYGHVQPGMIMELAPGESIESASPGRPNSDAGPWIALILRGIAVGTGLSYEKIARDFSQTTFSSNRASELEDRRRFRQWQRMLINHLIQPVWDGFVEAAAIDGNKAFPSLADVLEDRRGHACVEFQPPTWEWVDPTSEQNAAEAAIKSGMSTYQDELGPRGKNFRRVFKQQQVEKELRKKLGLLPADATEEANAQSKLMSAEAEQKTAEAATIAANQKPESNGKPDATETVKKKVTERFDPNQPRDPGGEGGGQWVKSGGSGSSVGGVNEIMEKWENDGIDSFISEDDSTITLSKIVVPKDGRENGSGTKAMKELIAYADKVGKPITLTPSTDFGASSKSRLVKFYKKFGFVENKGKNKDFAISESMYRPTNRSLDTSRSPVALEGHDQEIERARRPGHVGSITNLSANKIKQLVKKKTGVSVEVTVDAEGHMKIKGKGVSGEYVPQRTLLIKHGKDTFSVLDNRWIKTTRAGEPLEPFMEKVTRQPYAAYRALKDDKTEPSHKKLERLGLNGTNIYRADDPMWFFFDPPWRLNCRCKKVRLTLKQAAGAGVAEAKRWLETGDPPKKPEYRLKAIPFRPGDEFDHWATRKRELERAEDCGTGAGGFKTGNTCAGGGGSSGAGSEFDISTRLIEPWGVPQFVFKKGGKEIGELQLKLKAKDSKDMVVANLLVWPEFQRQGNATKFYKHAASWVEKRGGKLFVSKNRTDAALALHAHFKKIGVLDDNGRIHFQPKPEPKRDKNNIRILD